MDLVATLSMNGILSVYRTFSWERVFTERDIVGGSASALSFSPSGKVIAVGSDDGVVAVLDLETSYHMPAHPLHGLAQSPVSAIEWVQITQTPSVSEPYDFDHTWLHGGVNMAARVGMREWVEAEEAEGEVGPDAVSLSALLPSIAGALMLVLHRETGVLVAYSCCLFPLFSVKVNIAFPEPSSIWKGASHLARHIGETECICMLSRLYTSPASSASSLEVRDVGAAGPHTGVEVRLLNAPEIAAHKWYEHKARLLLQMHRDVRRMEKVITDCGKKWKDAAKVIPAKMTLLKSILNGYEVEHTPVEFLYSVALCGHWHPAAQAAFSTNWNEQGLQRLRSSIDAASKDVLKLLHLNLYPTIVNFILRCREMVALLSVELQRNPRDQVKQRSRELQTLIFSSEALLYKFDETLNEAHVATRAMKLFLQFVKTNMAIAAAGDSSATRAQADPNPKKAYLPLFDPRVPRAEGVPAQAEHVCATHLYAYFLDDPIPDAVVEHRRGTNGFYTEDPPPHINHSDTIREILKLSESGVLFEGISTIEPLPSDDKLAQVSLLTQFKSVKTLFESFFQNNQYNAVLNLEPSELRSSVKINLLTEPGNAGCLAEDVASISGTSITVQGGNVGDDRDGSSRSIFIDHGQVFSLLLGKDTGSLCQCNGGAADCGILVLWRQNKIGTDCAEWYAACIRPAQLPQNFCLHNTLSMRLYVSTMHEGHGNTRASVMLIVRSAAGDSCCLLKLNLLDLQYCVITHSVNESSSGSVDTVSVNVDSIRYIGHSSVEVKSRILNCSGAVIDLISSALRGVSCLLMSGSVDASHSRMGLAESMVLLDMEEDECDDESDEDESGGEESGSDDGTMVI